MKTRRNRGYHLVWKPVFSILELLLLLPYLTFFSSNSEVERELGLLFAKGAKWSSGIGNKTKQPRSGTKFQMLVEDVREGVLVSV